MVAAATVPIVGDGGEVAEGAGHPGADPVIPRIVREAVGEAEAVAPGENGVEVAEQHNQGANLGAAGAASHLEDEPRCEEQGGILHRDDAEDLRVLDFHQNSPARDNAQAHQVGEVGDD